MQPSALCSPHRLHSLYDQQVMSIRCYLANAPIIQNNRVSTDQPVPVPRVSVLLIPQMHDPNKLVRATKKLSNDSRFNANDKVTTEIRWTKHSIQNLFWWGYYKSKILGCLHIIIKSVVNSSTKILHVGVAKLCKSKTLRTEAIPFPWLHRKLSNGLVQLQS